MTTEPKVEERPAQPYMGVRTLATMQELSTAIPQGHSQVFAWLGQQGIAPSGPPFIRYHVIDMERQLDIELGVPVASTVDGDDHVAAGVLPAGRYAALIYTGVENGIAGNWELLKWGAAQGLVWDQWATPQGDGWGARYESFLTDPADEPDMAKWETEVAIRLADE
jgi:effector-binding domain-containing protein